MDTPTYEICPFLDYHGNAVLFCVLADGHEAERFPSEWEAEFCVAWHEARAEAFDRDYAAACAENTQRSAA
jgi:hypothetical protein